MANRIPDTVIEEVRERSDIVEVVSSFLPLKKAGKNFKALCPFHTEKTPSFVVNPEKQLYHCFGCGAGGNVFAFLMKQENLTFLEALKVLAEKAGVRLPEAREKAGADTLRLYETVTMAADHFHSCLLGEAGGKAREYLSGRKITKETVDKFHLGYGLPSWDGLLKAAGKRGFSPDLMERAGLAVRREKGDGFYDRFRNRLIFPIFNPQGRAIGFGARTLDDSIPKYINSPETPVYHKGGELYGLNFSREEIHRKDSAIVVEGYLDLLRIFQEGITNVVASLGTALTSAQVGLLRRYTREVVMVYDSDRAGVSATLRSLDLLLEKELKVRIVSLPENLDPDDFIQQKGKKGFEKSIAEARNLIDYKLNLLSSEYDSTKVEGRVSIIDEMLPTLSKVANAVGRREYLKELAEKLSVDEEALQMELRKFSRKGGTRKSSLRELEKLPPLTAERGLLQLLLEDSSLIEEVRKELGSGSFTDPDYRRIAEAFFSSTEEARRVINLHQDERLGSSVAQILMEPIKQTGDRKKVLKDYIDKIKRQKRRREMTKMRKMIKEAEDKGEVDLLKDLLLEYQGLMKA